MVPDVVQLPLPQTAVSADGEVTGADAAERHGQVAELGPVALGRAQVVRPGHVGGSMGSAPTSRSSALGSGGRGTDGRSR